MLSIITVNKNNLRGLIQTVDSVSNQTYIEIEHIIIDGASKDGSLQYLSTLERDIKWVSESDEGIYDAMNKGIKMALGEYVLFINSGDTLINNNSIARASRHLNDQDLLSFKLRVVENKRQYDKSYPKVLNFAYFLMDTLPHPSTFIKRSLFYEIGFFNSNFKIVSDWKFFLDATCKYNKRYAYVDEPLSIFFNNGISSKTENKSLIDYEKSIVLKNEYALFMEDSKIALQLMKKVNNLRKSKKIQLLIKLGLINNF